jgi:hypothetical protein
LDDKLVATCHSGTNLLCIIGHPTAALGATTMCAHDQQAVAYFAIVALLESRIISPATRRQLEELRDKLEEEMAAEDNKSHNAAAS